MHTSPKHTAVITKTTGLRQRTVIALTFIFTLPLAAQQTPTPAAAEWWRLTSALSNDTMEGRDTGTEAYERAAKYVADQFQADHLKPAGDNGTYFQRVPMHQVDLVEADSYLMTTPTLGQQVSLKFSTSLATTPRRDVDIPSAPVVFLGYGMPSADLDLKGKLVVFFNNVPAGLAPAERERFPAHRLRALTDAGVAAIFSIDNLSSIEPPHWPAAYNRSVTLAGAAPPDSRTPPVLRLNPDIIGALFSNFHDPRIQTILKTGGTGAPLDSFPTGQSATLHIKTTEKDISSPNILAILPGSDPSLAPEYVALSAHLDGYGFGTPVLGDALYNGALDDAAYVATLLELAHTQSTHPPKRSLLFCIFTGEEKGLLGSVYFTQHLTVPPTQIVADLNLDQLRPIFPLKILTMEGIADSSIGDTAKGVASTYGIELRPDHELERNLFRRSDNYSFVRIGVPIGSFIFGYNPGTDEERIYRDWYARRYHKPQDDLATPIDWAAAVTFNHFYRDLALALANSAGRPHWLPTSPYAPK